MSQKTSLMITIYETYTSGSGSTKNGLLDTYKSRSPMIGMAYKLAKGTRDECGFDQRDILQLIIVTGADAFSMAHNHPMGPAIPSIEDIDASHSLRVRAEYFGVELFDHFIISKKSHYSFREHQLLWN